MTTEAAHMVDKIKKIYYFSSTHWDREWYSVFQRYRFRLIEVTDGIIDTLLNVDGFPHITFDGQVSALKDYLAIKPENEPVIRELLKSGKLSVGPWYTMPDEFLVSGESLIRNLQLGFVESRSLGAEPMRFGYSCDVFGHIAQLPQILKGFSIGGALVGRGTNDSELESFIKWQSPDGSSVSAYRVPESAGYGGFYTEVIMPKRANNEADNAAMFRRAEEYVLRETERSGVPYVVLMDGADHEKIHSEAVLIARHLEKKFNCPVVFDSLEKLTDDIAGYVVSVKSGEMNQTAKAVAVHNKLITHTLSGRVDLKLANGAAETLLEKYALPFAALANSKGAEIPPNFIKTAYKYLILNHAHDSICGCSVDEVHRDMDYRFRQARYIASEVRDSALAYLTGWEASDGGGDLAVKIFNPLPYERRETVTADIQFPPDWATAYCEQVDTERINSFLLSDADGNNIPYQILKIRKNSFCALPNHGANVSRDIYTVALNAVLPPCGFIELKVVPSALPSRYLHERVAAEFSAENEFIKLTINDDGTFDILDKETGREYPALHSFLDDAETGDGWFHYSPVNSSVSSSRGGRHCIEKISDGPVSASFRITSYICTPKAAACGSEIRRSDEYAELKISSAVTLGANNWIDINTVVYNTVKDHRLRLVLPVKGADRDRYTVNQAFCFIERPSGVEKGTGDWSESAKPEKQFESIVLRKGADGGGLAFISGGGLHEVAAGDGDAADMQITLMRCFRRTYLTDGQPDGQLQGATEFKYRLMPLGAESLAELTRVKDSLTAGTYSFCGKTGKTGSTYSFCGENGKTDGTSWSCGKTGKTGGASWPCGENGKTGSRSGLCGENGKTGGAPWLCGKTGKIDGASWFSLESVHCVLSCMETVKPGVLTVRIWNCSDDTNTAKLRFDRKVKSAVLVNLDGKPLYNPNGKPLCNPSDNPSGDLNGNPSDTLLITCGVPELKLNPWSIATAEIVF
jgi:hypothetical protein